jgi:multisubunit Na+/H+ antiporter MnhF subunit
METVTIIAYVVLLVSGVLCAPRVAKGPLLADRVLALDSLLIVGVVGVAIESARTRSGVYAALGRELRDSCFQAEQASRP